MGLDQQAANWPTPDVCSANRDMSRIDPDQQKTASGKRTIGLPTIASAFSPQAQQIQDGQESSPADPTSRRRLNPRFVEWLMGFPLGWTNTEPTDCDAAAMESWRCRHLSALSLLLDGQE
jgi:hypothetical protein